MNEIPIALFIGMVFALFVCMVVSVLKIPQLNIITGIIAVILSYTLSKISINGVLVERFGDVTSSDIVITDTVVITNLPMSYLFLFIGILTFIITTMNILNEIRSNLEPDIEAIDFE